MKTCSTLIQIVLPIIIGLWLTVAQAFQITPMVIETSTTRGMAGGMITVKNLGRETTYLRVSSEPFTFNAEGLESLKSSPQDLSHYLRFAPRRLTIRPGQSRRIRLNVRFLPSTQRGEYRAMIFTEPVQESGERQMGVIPRIGVAMYVRYGSYIKAQLSVRNATYKNKSIVLRVNNTGQATARPRVNWVLKKSWREIASGRSNKHTVIAEGQRNLKMGGNQFPKIESLSAGSYQISGELVWGAREENSLSFNEEFFVPYY